jgi:hypothetical protein
MGIGRPPEFTPLLEHTDILVMSWDGTVPMMAHAVGIELDEITTTRDKWVTDTAITTAKGVINPRGGGGDPRHDQRHVQGRAPRPAAGWATTLDLPLIPGAGTIR